MSLDRIINVSSARGESQADILRRTGQYGVLPSDSDAVAMSKLNAQAQAWAEGTLPGGAGTKSAKEHAEDSATSAATAEAAAGPTYASTAAGLAATTSGEAFAVDAGGGLVSVYLNSSGTAVLQRTLATTEALAASGGSTLVGFLQSGAGAVSRTVQDKGREVVSVKDFGAVGDGAADDMSAILAAIATGRAVDLGGPENVYRVRSTMLVSANNVVLFGSGATIRMDHTLAGYVTPIMRVTGDYFRSWGIKWDHNAVGVALPAVANQVSIAMLDAVMLGGDSFDFSGEVYNSAVNGIGIGSFSVTGNGSGGSPFNATQTVGEPKNWRIGTVYGENCGIGNQNYAAYSEFGKKGAVVNVLTAADGVIGSVNGKGNSNGLSVDFAGGAEGSIGPCAFSAGLRDGTYPLNGSGIDYYFGSGGIVAPSLKSDEAPRFGLAIVESAGDIVVGAQLHASGESGARITGGRVSGTISVSAAGLATNNTFDAVSIEAGSADIAVNLNVSVSVPVSGNRPRYSYASSHSGGNRVRGVVNLVADAGITGRFNRGSLEVLSVNGLQSCEHYGVFGFSVAPILDTTTRAFFAGDVTLMNSSPVYAARLVYDLADNRWEHVADGYGFILRQDTTTGAITLQKSGNNTGGVGAPASLTTVATW